VNVYSTTKYVFDIRDEDIFWCTADVGWVTGHSYIVYGPLANGATVVMYEGAPNWPEPDRFWRIIEEYRVNILYTAPTAIRAFIRWGDDWVRKHDLSSLRLLGSVGEPINPEAWMWYHKTIGGGRCPIVDTWWQTETGSIMISPFPGAIPTKPGSGTLPFFGVDPAVVDERAGSRPECRWQINYSAAVAFDVAHDLRRQGVTDSNIGANSKALSHRRRRAPRSKTVIFGSSAASTMF
jgi:acetyl-CoA synthetase